MKLPKIKIKLHHIKYSLKIWFWFSAGAFLSLFFISTSIFLIFQKLNVNKVYPGIIVNGINYGGMSQEEVKNSFLRKNESIENVQLIFLDNKIPIATTSAKEINYGYDADLISIQALSIGRSKNILTNIYLISKAYVAGVYLPATYSYSQNKLDNVLQSYKEKIERKPVDALFRFDNGKVTAFRASSEGQVIDTENLNKQLIENGPKIFGLMLKKTEITVPLKILKPSVTTENTNKFGIKELVGIGKSTFYHSIPGRVYNINLAASRINGTLVAPGDVFSFDDILGDVSSFTGYQQAYIIKDGKTVLGDGGGVCQVSTTLFRAALNAGLPIIERHAHAYRVGYYEQDSAPGIDATTYVPSVDLKFKNDTGNYILIQTQTDLDNLSLTFYLYGTKDGRTVNMTTPVITSQTPPPPPLYQDDPTLPKGTIKQIDFEAWGANVYFTREVKKDNKVIISEKYVSNYQPWQAVYLRGTKE